jgi:uncharacterized LabA/DUF88 family protein
MRAAVYVDGFNLYYAIRNSGCKWLNLKSLAEQLLPAGASIAKIRYFTARVSGALDSDAPRRQQIYFKALETVPEIEFHFGTFLAKTQWRPVVMLPIADRPMHKSNESVCFAPGVVVVEPDRETPNSIREDFVCGKYGEKPADRKPTVANNALKSKIFSMEEKGSDVNLAVHLLNDAWLNAFDVAAVVSNDSDLVEPIRIVAAQLKKPVYLLTPPNAFGASPALRKVATYSRHIHKSHLQAAQFPDSILSAGTGEAIQRPVGW